MNKIEVRTVEPLTDAELDILTYVTVSSFVIGLVCFLVCLAAAIYVSAKSTVPGRNLILFSLILLICIVGYEQYMGGNLEWVFGPVANLYKVIAYSTTLLIFCVGYVRACKLFSKK